MVSDSASFLLSNAIVMSLPHIIIFMQAAIVNRHINHKVGEFASTTVHNVLCPARCGKASLVYVTLATKRFGRVKHWLVGRHYDFPPQGTSEVAPVKPQIPPKKPTYSVKYKLCIVPKWLLGKHIPSRFAYGWHQRRLRTVNIPKRFRMRLKCNQVL